jgi:hypothetical protein
MEKRKVRLMLLRCSLAWAKILVLSRKSRATR